MATRAKKSKKGQNLPIRQFVPFEAVYYPCRVGGHLDGQPEDLMDAC